MKGKKRSSIRAVSLFCGCGGADLGLIGGFDYLNRKYHDLNICITHASDIDHKAIATYNMNFSEKAIVEDINNLSFSRGCAEIVIGGFPCQPFSTVNPTKSPDNKDRQLFWQMANVIDQIRPMVFVAENVKGFYTLSKGKYFQLAKEAFERLGYRAVAKLIDSSDYGIPQRRQRLIMVGVKNSMRKSFAFSLPTQSLRSKNSIPKVKLASVIESLVPSDPKYYFSKKAVEGVKKAKPNMKRALAQDLNGQCLTITSHLAKVSLNSRDPVLLVDRKKELYRRFSPREAARIQSFPDTFVFSGSEADAYRQIGNAVPPVVMWHITRAIINQLF